MGENYIGNSIVQTNLKATDAMTVLPAEAQAEYKNQTSLPDKHQDFLLANKVINGETLEATSVAQNSLSNDLCESKEGSEFIRTLWIQFERLVRKEKAMDKVLGNEKVEDLVSKVDDVAEFEMMMDELWLRTRTAKGDGELLQLKNDCKIERHESYLEEIKLLTTDEKLKDEVKGAHGLWKFHWPRDKTACEALQQFREEEGVNSEENIDTERVFGWNGKAHLNRCPSQAIIQSSDVMSIEADKRSGEGRQALKGLLQVNHELEDPFHFEQRTLEMKDEHLSTEILIVQRDMDNQKEFTAENYSSVGLEKNRRKEWHLEAQQTLELWEAEVKEHKETSDRLKELEGFLCQLKKKAAELSPIVQTGPNAAAVSDTLKDFFESLVHHRMQSQQHCSDCSQRALHSFDLNSMEKLRDERNQLEAQRDRLRNELNLVVAHTIDIENKNKAIWLEKERHFISEATRVQAKADQLEELVKKIEMSHIQERHYWEGQLQMCRNEWKNERDILYKKLRESENKLRKESGIWSRLLEAKDEELAALKSVAKKVVGTLTANKQCFAELKKQLISQNKGQEKVPEPCVEDERVYTCPGDEITFLGKLVMHTETEIGRLSLDLREEHDRLQKERDEARLCAMQLKQEKMEIEKKISETVSLMEHLKGQMKSEKEHMSWERNPAVMFLMMKSAEIEKLRGELYSKEQEREMITQKFQDETVMIEKEIEEERKMRQKVTDLCISSCQNIIKEIRENEEWEKQNNRLTEDFLKLKEENLNKDHEVEMLREETNDIEFEDDKKCLTVKKMGGQLNQVYKKKINLNQIFRKHGRSPVEQVTFDSQCPNNNIINFQFLEDEGNDFVHF